MEALVYGNIDKTVSIFCEDVKNNKLLINFIF